MGGNLLATCGRDKTVWIWEYDEGEGDYECVTVLSEHTADVKSVRWLPHKDVLVSASYDETIRVWAEDLDDWYAVDTLKGHQSTVWDIAVEGTGRRMASVGGDKNLVIWRLYDDGSKHGKWRADSTLANHKATIYSVDWAPTAEQSGAANAAASRSLGSAGESASISGSATAGACVATASGDDTLRIFHESSDSMQGGMFTLDVEVEEAHAGDINSVRWDPRGRGVLATGGDDELIRIWAYTPPGC